jgi:hypothetical protein
MIWFIIFLLIAYLSNSFIDAIDHGKGAFRLGFVWHLFKWGVCLPAYFLAGVSLVTGMIGIPFYEALGYFFGYYWKYLILWVFLHILWELHYKIWRIILEVKGWIKKDWL